MRGLVWLARVGAAVLVILSALTLVRLSFGISFFPPLASLLNGYERVMQAAFGRAEPLLGRVLAFINARTGSHLQLHPQWKHVLLLLILYFAVETGFCWSSACRKQAVRSGALGILIAVMLSLALGTIPPGSGEHTAGLALIVPVMLSTGVAILLWRLALATARVAETPYAHGRRLAGQGAFILMLLLAITIPVALALLAANPGILVAGCILAGLALANLVSGTMMRSDLNPDAPLGLFLFTAMTGTVAMLVVNAALMQAAT